MIDKEKISEDLKKHGLKSKYIPELIEYVNELKKQDPEKWKKIQNENYKKWKQEREEKK